MSNKNAHEMPEAVPSAWFVCLLGSIRLWSICGRFIVANKISFLSRRKYDTYDLCVDHQQNDKAEEINICSMARPHMRSFHCAWLSFFVAFFVWFSISPLLPEIKDTLRLSKDQIWTSSIAGVFGTTFVRFLLGPLCDMYGPRVLMSAVLCLAAIPVACTGFVQTATGLAFLRLCIGVAGGSFVMNQVSLLSTKSRKRPVVSSTNSIVFTSTVKYWGSTTFTLETVGLANGLIAGWGNLGAGVTHSVMGLVLFPLLKTWYDGDSEKAWRTACVIPAIVAVGTAILIYKVSDDTPKGNFSELKAHGVMTAPSFMESFWVGMLDLNTWIMAIQYGCCFGVQLTMNNAAALYFKDEFGQSTESAAAIASVFSWMLLFARALGGFSSDIANASFGMRGRLVVHTVFLFCEGGFVLLFSNTTSLIGAICIMMIFSVFVNGACGSSFGIVPYLKPDFTGSVTGVIGAGGNIGAAIFGLLFQQLPYRQAFLIMGLLAIASSGLSFFVTIDGQSTMRWWASKRDGEERPTNTV
jgi:MFS transporter, NNP family, nitrate/nitrite transporter